MANGIVLGGSLRCRKSPTTSADVWGSFSNGTVLTVTNSSDDEWFQTTWNGSVGYVMKSFVAVAGDTVQVNATNVNVRNNPGTSGTTVLYQLDSPATAEVVSVDTDWVHIQPSGEEDGWISADYVDKSSGSSSGGSTGGDEGSGGDTGGGDDTTFQAGHFGRTTKTGVRVRLTPGSDDFVQVVKGSMFYIEGTVTGPTISGSTSTLWVKVRFGKGDGTYESRYIHSSCFGDTLTITNSVKTRIVAIAQTLVNNTGGNLGMGGDWCQRFIYWLCAASGMSASMPYSEGYCGQARLAMVNSYGAQWHQRGDGYIPSAGDLIYFGELNSNVSSHVGLVYQGGNSFKTVEGNLSDKVQLREGSVSAGECGDRSYQGFLRLNI